MDALAPPNLREQGTALLKQGKFADAIEMLSQAAQETPNDEGIWRLLGAAYSSLNTPDSHLKAEDAFTRAVALAPTVARSHFNLAIAQQAAGSIEPARQSLERALSLQPDYAQARARLEALPPPPEPDSHPIVPEPEVPETPPRVGPVDIASLYAPPKPEKSPSSTAVAPPSETSGNGMAPMGLMGVGEDKGYVPPPPPPPVAAPLPVLGPEGSGPVLRAAAPDANASTGAVFYDQLSRAESNAYLTGMYGNKNTSGMQSSVPPEASAGFNLGAAIFPFWWLRAHNLRPIGIGIVVIYFILRSVGNAIHSPLPGFLVNGLQIIMFFVLGFMGNKIAWQNRTFDDVDDFKACQRIWMGWAIAGIVVEVGFTVFMYMTVQSLIGSAGGGRGGGISGPPQGF